MPAYIAMLRGINVSGKNIIKMESLRDSCAGIGFRDVRTYVQSGNIVFSVSRGSVSALEKAIRAMILRDFNLEVPVLVRTATSLGEVLRKNPFLKEKGTDPSKLHVTFLSEPASKESIKKLADLPQGRDRFVVSGSEIFLDCPVGYGRTKLTNTAFEKMLSTQATTRNWNTVNALFRMASEPGGH